MTVPRHLVCNAPGPGGARCWLAIGHSAEHAGEVRWPLAAAGDDAPTAKLPPIRESIGPRRRPPAAVVEEFRDRLQMLEALAEEIAGYDEDDR